MNIPKGYKLVPVEPNEEMLEVMHSHVKIQVDTWERTADIINDKEWWASVVEAAPAPPQPIYDEAKERYLFEDHQHSIGASKRKGSSGVYFEITAQAAWLGWKACAQSRAKAGEVGHE